VRNLRVLELETSKDDLEGFFASIDQMPSELREVNIDLREEDASSSTSSSSQPVHHSTKSFDGNISTTLQDVMPSFFRFLQSIGTLKNFHKIVLKNVTVPQSLPFDFSQLSQLQHLDLSGSTNLTTLPKSFSQLLQLQHLALRDCIKLSIPMHILGQITTLEHIDFKGCAQLVQLPEGISSQRSLRYLNLLETRLRESALNLEPLGKLEQLIIGSASLKELSCSVENLVHLKELILVKCKSLMQIHTPNEQLAYLERLEIYDSSLTHLPAAIAVQKHLKVLTIHNSPIENFALDMDALTNLTNLTLMHTSISEISIPVGACPRLEIVDLSDNRQLRQVQVFQPTLVKLNLDGCLSLEYLRLAELVHLKCLDINGCGCVETLDVENWRSMEEIRAERCLNLRMREETWSQLKRLNFFSFSQKFPWDEVST
jgi:Leucine-rich repeat (LRR) protein